MHISDRLQFCAILKENTRWKTHEKNMLKKSQIVQQFFLLIFGLDGISLTILNELKAQN